MTGYGEAKIKAGDTELSVVIKSVNGRFLDVRSHLPKEYFQFEPQLKKDIGAKIRRGTVDIFIHRKGVAQIDIRLNHDIAKKWLSAYRKLAKSLKLPIEDARVMDRLSSLPQLIEVRDLSELKGTEKSALLALFHKALGKCEKERLREGLSLKADLFKILRALDQVVKKMEGLRETISKGQSEKIKERLKRLGLEGQVEPARFAQELVIYLDKCDIAEEISRLREHIRMCEKYLDIKEEQGKKLDFYSQELLREINTIGSKANSAQVTGFVVQAKGYIEAFKEQVQNIE